MTLLKRICSTLFRNLTGLTLMAAFIILVAFLPTAFSVRMPEPVNSSGGPRLQAVQLDKAWTITEESAAYMTVKSSGEMVNFKFPTIKGYWVLDVAKPENMRAVASVPINTVDSGNALRDHALQSADILNAATFPEAKFELTTASSWPTEWDQNKAQRFILKGNLTLKGITKPVELDTEAKYLDDRILLKAKTKIHMPDFQIQNLGSLFLNTEEDGEITLQLFLEDRGDLSPEVKLPTAALSTLATPNPKIDVPTTYKANVHIDPSLQTVDGTVEIQTQNDTQTPQDTLYFHLYPNQFQFAEELTAPVWDKLLGTEQRLPGWIDVQHLEVNGQEVPIHVKKTLLEVPLAKWQPGATAYIKLEFHLVIPRNTGRIAYNEHEIWLGNWLPIRAIYEKSAWRLDPYYPLGDPFYSETANYEVNVTLPKNYRVASTGSDLEIGVDATNRHYTISAPQVRDFALVAMDDTYESTQERVGDVLVKTWFRKLDNPYYVQELHNVGTKSIQYYSQHYGAYPFPEYDIVPTGFFSGMEYPGLIMVNGEYLNSSNPTGYFTVLHETGHQWWYSAVGNDQIRESWLDEGLNDYTNMRFLLEYDPEKAQGMIKAREDNLKNIREWEKNGETMSDSLDLFSSWKSYGGLAYQKGSLMFYHLDQAVGQETMDRVLHNYYETYRFKNAHASDLIALFEQELGPEVRTYFETWLNGGQMEFTPKQGGKHP